MSAHFCSLFHHFITNPLTSYGCWMQLLLQSDTHNCGICPRGTIKSLPYSVFSCLSAALGALQGYSSAPVTKESFAEKVSLAHQADQDKTFSLFFGNPELKR